LALTLEITAAEELTGTLFTSPSVAEVDLAARATAVALQIEGIPHHLP
jgi:hypothetical protein